jgi:DNA processing protein
MNDLRSGINEEELLLRLALHLLPGIGPVLARNLVSYCGSVQAIFKAKKNQLEKIPGIGNERASRILKHREIGKAEKELRFIQRENIRFLFYLDKEYPSRLKNCEDAPVGLFCKGEMDLNPDRILAIVGTRHMTSYGKESTAKLVHELQQYNVTIASGLAYGIDSVAHREALRNNLPTIGVIAHGLKQIYPAEHRQLASQMIRSGGLISEYESDSKAEVDNFPARNRIVAGMADGVIVVESAGRGGALITADLANGYNREVMAVPGRNSDQYSNGCNELIRLNKAALIQSGKDVAELMNWSDDPLVKQEKPRYIQAELFDALSADEQKVISLLKPGKQLLDELSIRTGISTGLISSMLLKLEFDGFIRALPGKQFQLKE